MILQRHPELNLQIRERGCYFISILWHVACLRDLFFAPETVNDFYQIFVDNGLMEKDCYILKPAEMFHYFGVNAKYTNRHEPPQRVCGPGEVEILKFVYDRPGTYSWEHFVAGDGWGGVKYDPWGESKAVAHGYLKDKRIFKVF
jgi:hypothetical protein